MKRYVFIKISSKILNFYGKNKNMLLLRNKHKKYGDSYKELINGDDDKSE
jgi:hypothetical protein